MDKEKWALVISAICIMAVVVLTLLCYFFPYLLPFVLLFACVFTAVAAARTKLCWGGMACAGIFSPIVIIFGGITGYLCLPIYMLLSIAIVIYLRDKRLAGNIVILASTAIIGLFISLGAMSLFFGASPLSSCEEFVRRSESPLVYSEAKKYMVYEQMLDVGDISKEEYILEEQRAIERVEHMPKNLVLNNYAVYMKNHLTKYLLMYICLIGALGAALMAFLSTILYRIKCECAIKKLTEWEIPKGYTPGVFIPLILVFLIGMSNDLFALVYVSLSPALILVPYGACGMSLVVYIITRKGKWHALAGVVVVLLLFIFPIFIFLGIADKMIQLRKIVKIIDKI